MTIAKISPENAAFITVLTSTSYLAGVIVLHQSILEHSIYPLIVAVVDGLTTESTISILEDAGCQVRRVPLLQGPPEMTFIAERFKDVWCKLRVWDLDDYERLILLDADMMLKQNMDELFQVNIPEGWIAAVSPCICNPTNASWALPGWDEENCVFTLVAQSGNKIDPPRSTGPDVIPQHRDINAGLIILTPSRAVFEKMHTIIRTSPEVAKYLFPEQDLLRMYYYDKWMPLSWQYNAYKTHPELHPRLWSDEEVKNVHYIVDKPWEHPPVKGGPYEKLESWWWDMWRKWERATDVKVVCKVKETMKAFDQQLRKS